MSLQHPRRIFRPSSPIVARRGVSRAIGAALLGGLSIGLLLLLSLSSDLFGRAPPATGRVAAEAAQVAVVDGETLRLGQVVVRLLAVEAPERGEACTGADGLVHDCGAAAANALAALIRGRPLDCRLRGQDRMARPLALCEASGVELNWAMVAAGWARAGRALPELREEEKLAKVQRRGLWASGK